MLLLHAAELVAHTADLRLADRSLRCWAIGVLHGDSVVHHQTGLPTCSSATPPKVISRAPVSVGTALVRHAQHVDGGKGRALPCAWVMQRTGRRAGLAKRGGKLAQWPGAGFAPDTSENGHLASNVLMREDQSFKMPCKQTSEASTASAAHRTEMESSQGSRAPASGAKYSRQGTPNSPKQS